MPEELKFRCNCGVSNWTISPVGQQYGNHIKCFCKDCQAYLHHLGTTNGLDENGGTAIFQTLPEFLDLSGVGDNLAALRIKKGGAIRWYAKCCNTPICNTGSTPKFSFVGMVAHPAENPDAFGKLRAHVNIPEGVSVRKFGMGRVVRKILSGVLKARITGSWRQTPLFDAATETPKADIHWLTSEEIAAAYPQ